MIAQSIPELTNYEHNELHYDSAGTLITGDFIYEVCDLLNKCGIIIQPVNVYNDIVANAVLRFQKLIMLKATGILTTSVLQAMISYASSKMSNIIDNEEDELEIDYDAGKPSDSPHYNSFFNDDNYKMHRRNHKDIKIVFGNKSITKTIKDVFMRSVSIEVDTSGNPISEVYEFIARDVKESDEINDANSYNGDEETHLYPSNSIRYNFSSVTSDTNI